MDPKIIIAIVIVLVVIVGAVLLIKKNTVKEPINCPVSTCAPCAVTTCPPIPALFGRWKIIKGMPNNNENILIIYPENGAYWLMLISTQPAITSTDVDTGMTTVLQQEYTATSTVSLGVPTMSGNSYMFNLTQGQVNIDLNADYAVVRSSDVLYEMIRV